MVPQSQVMRGALARVLFCKFAGSLKGWQRDASRVRSTRFLPAAGIVGRASAGSRVSDECNFPVGFLCRPEPLKIEIPYPPHITPRFHSDLPYQNGPNCRSLPALF